MTGAVVEAMPRARPAAEPHAGRWTLLEPLVAGHAADLWPRAEAAPDSFAFLPFGPFAGEAAFRGYLRLAGASREELLWAVRPLGADGMPGPAAGWIGLLDIRPTHAAVELGNIWFPPGLARTRAATEACFLLLDHVLGDLRYLRAGWKCNALHPASGRAAERLGFRHEGRLRAHMIARGRRRDTDWYGLLAEEWPERRAAIAAWLDPANFDAAGQERRKLARAG